MDLRGEIETAEDGVQEGWNIDSKANLHDSSRALLKINNIDLKDLGYHDSTFRANPDQMKIMKMYQMKKKGMSIGNNLIQSKINPSLKMGKRKFKINANSGISSK